MMMIMIMMILGEACVRLFFPENVVIVSGINRV
jgi:hypothetical protein